MSRTESATHFAWQGWQLDLPSRWSPVKLEGDYDRGYALFADLHRPRLGIRWQKIDNTKKFDAAKWAQRALRNEVGQLAADEAVDCPMSGESRDLWKSPRLYLEPETPGRDVWLAYSVASGRVVELIHHAHRRERILVESILPTLNDAPCGKDDIVPWSIFDLSFRLSGDWRLKSQRLNAGDLGLTFENRRQWLTVRQIAVAEIALKRQPLTRWLDQQEKSQARHYGADGDAVDISFQTGRERELKGLRRAMRRRRRFAWMRWLPAQVLTFALHDEARDRLIFVQTSDESTARDVIATVGWASASF